MNTTRTRRKREFGQKFIPWFYARTRSAMLPRSAQPASTRNRRLTAPARANFPRHNQPAGSRLSAISYRQAVLEDVSSMADIRAGDWGSAEMWKASIHSYLTGERDQS